MRACSNSAPMCSSSSAKLTGVISGGTRTFGPAGAATARAALNI